VREREHLEDLGVNGRKIPQLIFRKWDRSMHSIDLAQGKDRRRAGDTVINLCVQ